MKRRTRRANKKLRPNSLWTPIKGGNVNTITTGIVRPGEVYYITSPSAHYMKKMVQFHKEIPWTQNEKKEEKGK